MLKNMKIGTKLAIAFLMIAFIFIIAGVVFLLESQYALSESAFRQLESTRANKKAQVNAFFAERKNDMHMLVETVALFRQNTFQKLESVRESKKFQLEQYFHERLNDVTLASQSVSILQALSQFEAAVKDKESSEAVEKKFDVKLKKFMENHGYYNLFLIAKDGQIVYSASKNAEIGKNVLSREFKNGPLNRVFKKGSKGLTIQDFAPNVLLDENQHVALFAAPVFQNGEFIGVLVLCILPDQINSIVQQHHELGETGEVYLVGKLSGQISYRSDRVVKDKGKNIIGVEKNGKDITKALAGESATQMKIGSTDNVEITSYAPLKIPDLKWAIMVTIGLEETLTLKLVDKQEDFFTQYITQYGYYDAFLIYPQGRIFHTVMKEQDYNTNIITGMYANSGLGQLVREVLKTKTFGISDFSPYAPSHDEPAAFIALPLIVDNAVAMVVALQINDAKIDKFMHQRDGMGKTGEAYLVGSDKLMRSNSYLNPVTHSIKASFFNPVMGSVDTEGSRAALAGNTDTKIIQDYRNTLVLSAYTPIKVGNTIWALIVEIDKAEAFAAVTKLKWWLGIIILMGIIIIISIALLIIRSIKRPLSYLVDISQLIAAGNLNNDIVVTGKDEIGQLLQAFVDMQAKLHSIISSIQQAAEIVDASAEEIAQGNISLSQRTEQQAASLEETAASMEEMTSTVQQNSDNARMANQLGENARDKASKGGDVVGAAISAMTEINTSSKKVTEIISVINEIAFQTNLLALNAAVEAARAGEQGRGFAVVASEVRNLAQRSASASKEIKGLIQDSVTKVEEGTKLVNDSGNTLGEIVNSVKKVSDIVSEIAAASVEQSASINQVNKVVSQMDEMVQQNAAAVEETAAASESLKERARNLKEQVVFFNVGKQALLAKTSKNPSVKKRATKPRQTTDKNVKNEYSVPPSSSHDNNWQDF
ncbi:methyl-accepting chemotaxis protein [Candidatus Parabeggiatoa sp. HSG14]|uniref:methyl-accepting chemotaxis protein n=1 Tax=Candidatus Parabeggiatoa sp. HSG14 TaxID=3055593 RepID=UPI0025A8CB81|nr:methyl-accepting chemotaxis protein [Thiotrichales bacterium HSG14]